MRALLVALVACGGAPTRPHPPPVTAAGAGADAVPFDADARAAELAELRDILRDNYAHLDTKRAQWGVDLDGLYRRDEPRIRAADTWAKLELVMVGFLGEFHDGHLQWRRTRGAGEARRKIVRLGLATRFVGDALLVSAVWPGSQAQAAGLAVGDRIVEVEGLTIEHRMAEIAKLRSWSRPDDARYDFAQEWPAFRMPADAQVAPRHVTRVRPDGTRDTLAILPETKRLLPKPAPIDLDWRGTIAILAVRDLGGHVKDTAATAHELGKQIFARATGVVVDLRDDDGGFEDGAAAIVARLAPGPVVAGHTRVRLTDRTRAAHKEWRDLAADPAWPGWSVAVPMRVEGKAPRALAHVVGVIDAGCRSSCESLALYLRAMGAKLVGETTGGVAGAPLTITLPKSGARVKIPVRAAFDATGAPIEGHGVAPDEVIAPTAADITSGRDPALDRALDLAR